MCTYTEGEEDEGDSQEQNSIRGKPAHVKRALEVLIFINNTQVAPSRCQRGITWLELLAARESVHAFEGWADKSVEQIKGRIAINKL